MNAENIIGIVIYAFVSLFMMAIGIVIGIFGMGIMGLAYPMYKKLMVRERAKVAEQIIALSNELL